MRNSERYRRHSRCLEYREGDQNGGDSRDVMMVEVVAEAVLLLVVVVVVDSTTARTAVRSPCDFFLWRYLRDQVYAENLHSEEELHRSIEEKISANPLRLTSKVHQNMFRRLQECIVAPLEHSRRTSLSAPGVRIPLNQSPGPAGGGVG
ncbi:Uncharacterized protein GBIM_19592 [Gryllus bimaculatus]|nr:Uncharacterized protein GBIM_19592 [Gryllus bimaculatus]